MELFLSGGVKAESKLESKSIFPGRSRGQSRYFQAGVGVWAGVVWNVSTPQPWFIQERRKSYISTLLRALGLQKWFPNNDSGCSAFWASENGRQGAELTQCKIGSIQNSARLTFYIELSLNLASLWPDLTSTQLVWFIFKSTLLRDLLTE